MEQEIIQAFVNGNTILKKYMGYQREELEIIRMYINLELINIQKDEENKSKVKIIKTCLSEPYSYLEYMLSYRYKIDTNSVATQDSLDRVKTFSICEYCNCKICVKKSAAILMEEVEKYNSNNANKLSCLDVIDYILDRKIPVFETLPDKNIFDKVNLIDLMYIHLILESDLIVLSKYDSKNNIVEFDYMDLTQKSNNEYYINILLEFYKEGKQSKHLVLDINNIEEIYAEKDDVIRIYKIAAYYKYLIEVKKVDIIKKLREIVNMENVEQGIKMRTHYYIYKYFQKVEALPYSKNTKNKIYSILNYILNYRYKKGIPYIPINILIYSNDKEGVEKICDILGEFMWFFGYLSEQMRYYDEYMNNIILDKYLIKKLYDDDKTRKNGILLLHNFENLLYIDYMQQNLILNILTDEMEKNNRQVCTIIYGEREMLKQILGNHHKLSQMLINLELEIDNLDMNKIYELVIKKLEKNIEVSETVKEKIHNYIRATYMQSDTKNMEYVNKLYNLIILNMNSDFSLKKNQNLNIKDIPEAYNTRDLTTVMKDVNELVGLREIKEQLNDLVALLKFNKKAHIDINNFNLHMVFTGNPGTGKTTVARLIKDIFYYLGYISQNKITEVTAKDLIAEYLGQTSGKTYNVVKSALGGVLFIDEAYAITAGVGDGAQYGNECIATLLKLMEDYKDKLIIVFAGYEEEMRNFQNSNPGLVSRIGYKINFPDYTLEELMQIYSDLLEKNKLKITDEALEKLKNVVKEASGYEDFGNARYMHTVFQKVLIEHAKNIEMENQKNNLYQITEKDINREKLIAENKRKRIGF